MSLDKSHLQYPERSYGMDHDLYQWSQLSERQPVTWPGNKKLALWVNVNLQFFPLNQKGVPFKVPGGMTMPYPDLRHYSLRDYGNRVGIFRLLKAFDAYGVTPSFAISTRLAERNPYLLNAITERGNELLCHGYHMDALHYGGQDKQEEAELIKTALESLRVLSGQAINGWVSPAKNESENTPELLAENGIEYFCDWVNDDMPYRFNTSKAPLIAMPLSTELEDRFVIQNNLHSEESWRDQVLDASRFLIEEAAEQGGRILALNIHPWLMGQPHRIKFLEEVLEQLMANKDLWSASPGAILAEWKRQQ